MEYLLPVVAAFLAGVLNTLAGGGTFLTFPALVAAGLPPVAANATSAVAVFPGYASGALGFRAELAAMPRARLLRLSGWALAGGLAGAGLLTISSDAAFALVVPLLLLVSTLVFLFGGRLRGWAARRRGLAPYGGAALFAVALYGGYFNGGLGIVLLALFALWGMGDIHAMNGLKNGLSFVISAVSVAVFAVAGLVAWPMAVAMMVAATAGGYAGAPLARRIPARVLRWGIAAIGFTMTAIFAVRLL
ncbi:hypothetical protein BCF33_1402 [Hasllibacter halocynthiae]|uniref:Probable membrane transporter protein n=1 Tax=Hasllibacter halocynthiae TaxID=595589 RepID=A0A2T0XA60_9RHOB|nr:sulfite exporter TauE/SafE family protein [Hasllibacter halocynthiae]PRY95774.1 hypothetical protein BCF33_1402 [Hasllibacter halocynthiae]